MHDGVVIVGAGHAGVETAAALRRMGHDRPITLVDSAPQLPYQRPPLSKDYVKPGADATPLPLRADRFYADNRIDLRLGVGVRAIDLERRTATLADGTALDYDALVFATGARARHLECPGAALDGVHNLHTVGDAENLRDALERAAQVVVVGAGFIGLEFASAARAWGLDVTVLDRGHRPMSRVLSEPMSALFHRLHESAGVRMEFGCRPLAFEGSDGRVTAVRDDSGVRHPADLVVVGIGVTPAIELAAAAGLRVANGIAVDEYLCTGHQRVYAIGDCASYPHAGTGRRVRLEAVQNATDQARCVAAAIVGRPEPYTVVPWFWTAQYGMKLQIAGLPGPVTETVSLGSPDGGKGSLLGFERGRLVWVESVSAPADHLASRKLLAAPPPELTPGRARRPGFSLEELARNGILTAKVSVRS